MAMETREKRKALQRAYKEKEEIGCVSLYENRQNGKYLITGDLNMRGTQSRFEFSKATGSCGRMEFAADWAQYGPDAFSMTVLDTLKKDPDQSPQDFREEVQALADMYRAKRDPLLSY